MEPDAASYPHHDFAAQAEGGAGAVVGLLQDWLAPATVLDVGCGLGVWLEQWRERGARAVGVDGDYIDRSSLRFPSDDFHPADLTKPLDLGRRFDLVMSLEVAEHIDERFADTFVASLARHGDVILFSAAIPLQGGVSHVNCQWQAYWATKFAAEGFTALDVIRPRIWHDENIAWWYRQNTILYARHEVLTKLAGLPATLPIDVVHPRWYTDSHALPAVPDAARLLVTSVIESVRYRLRLLGGRKPRHR